MTECKLKRGTIISLNYKETIELKQGKIEVIPAWQWVMNSFNFTRGQSEN